MEVSHRRDDAALSRSIEELLTHHLKLSYRIKKSALDPWETDQAGRWWIAVSQPPTADAISQWESVIKSTDDADLAYYREQIAEDLAPSVSLDDFRLLRGEAALGPGSICEQLPCNIAILLRDDSPDLFVIISKI